MIGVGGQQQVGAIPVHVAPVPQPVQQAITQLVQHGNPPPPQLGQQPQVGQQGNPVGQLLATPQLRAHNFETRKNQWYLSATSFGSRFKEFLQRKFTSDGALKLGTAVVPSGMAKDNAQGSGIDALKTISGSPSDQAGVGAGAEFIAVMNFGAEILAYKAMQRTDQDARGKIQTYEDAQRALTQAREQLTAAEDRVTQATQERDDLQQNQRPQVLIDIDANAQARAQQQIRLDDHGRLFADANQALTDARTGRDTNTNTDAQVVQQLASEVTRAQQQVDALVLQGQALRTQMTTLTQQQTILGQRRDDINRRIDTLNADQNTAGSIDALTQQRGQRQQAVVAAELDLKITEATGELGKASKIETAQKAYQIGQLTQKTGVMGATGVNLGANVSSAITGTVGTFASVASVVSTGVGALSLPLDCYSLHRDLDAIKNAERTLEKVKDAKNNALLNLDSTDKAFLKMMKRKLPIADKKFSATYNSTKIIAGLGGATAVGFKIAVLAGCSAGAVVAGAACLTPIGWGLAGIAAATLIGYGIFKLVRFIRNKRQQQAYLETVKSPSPRNTPKGGQILGRMADEIIQVHPNQDPAKTEVQYRADVIQQLSATQGIDNAVRARAELALISRSRGYGVEIMTDRLRTEQNPPGHTRQLLTVLGVSPVELQKIVDSNQIGDARKLLGKRLRVA